VPEGRAPDPISGAAVGVRNGKPFQKDDFGGLLTKPNFQKGLNDSQVGRGNPRSFEHEEYQNAVRKPHHKSTMERQLASSGRQNNLTASFNQEELEHLDSLEEHDRGNRGGSNQRRPFFGQSSAIGGNQFSIEDLDASRSILRNDLEESQIEDPMDDIQRSNQHDDELNLNDMTET